MPFGIDEEELPAQATGASMPGQALATIPAQTPTEVVRQAAYGDDGADAYARLVTAGQQTRMPSAPSGMAAMVGSAPPAAPPSGFGPGDVMKGLGDVAIGAATSDPMYGQKRQLGEAKVAAQQQQQQMAAEKEYRQNASEFYTDLMPNVFKQFPGRPDLAVGLLQRAAVQRGLTVDPSVLIALNQRMTEGAMPLGKLNAIIMDPATPVLAVERMGATAKGANEALHAASLAEEALTQAQFAPAKAEATLGKSALEIARNIRTVNRPPTQQELESLDAANPPLAAWQVPIEDVEGGQRWMIGPKAQAPPGFIDINKLRKEKTRAGIALAKGKEDVLTTSATRTMKESAPKVRALAQELDGLVDRIKTGPFASRLQDFMAGKIGAPNEDFITFKGKADLLSSLLMRMHVGARGGERFMDKFDNLIGANKNSAENMHAVLRNVIIPYSDIVANAKEHDEIDVPEGGAIKTPSGGGVISAEDFLAE